MEESCIIRWQSYEDLLKSPPPEKLIIYNLYKYTWELMIRMGVMGKLAREKLTANRAAGNKSNYTSVVISYI